MSSKINKAKTAKDARNQSTRKVVTFKLPKKVEKAPRFRRPTTIHNLLFERSTGKCVPVVFTHLPPQENKPTYFNIRQTTLPDGFEKLCPICMKPRHSMEPLRNVCSDVMACVHVLVAELNGDVILRKSGDIMRVHYAGLVRAGNGSYVFSLVKGRDA